MTEPIDATGLMTDRGVGRYVLAPDDVIGIAVHHSVSGGTFFMSNDLDQDDELSHLLMIDQYHAWKGWGGFGYHLATFPSGRYYLCGRVTGARAHVAGRNNVLVGLVLIGTFTTSPPPPAQLVAAADGVAYMRRTYPGRPIGPHRVWALASDPTSCPGDTWQSWLPALTAPPQEEDDDMKLIQDSQRVYAVGASGKRHVDDQLELEVYVALVGAPRPVTNAQAAMIPDVASAGYLVQAVPSHRVFVLGEQGKRYIDDPHELKAYRSAGYVLGPQMSDAEANHIPDVA
jgi:hypothetical protein